MANQENQPSTSDFGHRLGIAMTHWAENHPHPDEKNVHFGKPVGQSGPTLRFTPREYAGEIVEQTEFGVMRTNYYWQFALNKKESPDVIISSIEDMALNFKANYEKLNKHVNPDEL